MQSTTPDHEREGTSSQPRPRFAVVATVLFGVLCFTDVVGFVTSWFRPFSWFDLCFSTTKLAFVVAVGWGLYVGRQWARVLAAVAIVLSIPTAVLGPLFVMKSGWLLTALILRLCAAVGLFVVLSRNTVKQWYSRSRV